MGLLTNNMVAQWTTHHGHRHADLRLPCHSPSKTWMSWLVICAHGMATCLAAHVFDKVRAKEWCTAGTVFRPKSSNIPSSHHVPLHHAEKPLTCYQPIELTVAIPHKNWCDNFTKNFYHELQVLGITLMTEDARMSGWTFAMVQSSLTAR